MSKPLRARWTVLATLAVTTAFLALLVVQPTKTGAANHATSTTIPCAGTRLSTDYQIDHCLESKIRTMTARMDSALRTESAYLHYATKAQDWRVAQRTQSTFVSYAHAECLSQANPYQSGTIVPIIYGECVLELYGQRLDNLRQTIASFKKGGEAQRVS